MCLTFEDYTNPLTRETPLNKLTLLENWKIVLTEAWSIKLGAIASIILTVAETIEYIPLGDTEITKGIAEVLRYLSYTVGASGLFARLLDQKLNEKSNEST